MINLSDKLTAKTVENILGESKEIAYVYGDANLRNENTVASNLNELNDEIVQKVNIGDIVGDVSGTWQQGSVEQYVDNRINELEVQVNKKLAIQQDKINTMNGNECLTVNTLPQTGTVGIVYRVPNDPDSEHYSDYMWDTSIATPAWKKLAEYTIPGIDQKPTHGSENLVESGGVFDEIVLNSGAFDLTAYNSGTTYASLSAALSEMNSNEYTPYKKGGMSLRFALSSDNKYVQYFLTKDEWSANEADWEKLNLEEELEQLTEKIGGSYHAKLELEQGLIVFSSGVEASSSNTIRTSNFIVCDAISIKTSGSKVGVIGYKNDGTYVGCSDPNWITTSQIFKIDGADKYRLEFRNAGQTNIIPNDYNSLSVEIDAVFNEKTATKEELAEIQEEITEIQDDVTEIQNDIYTVETTEYERSSFWEGYLATQTSSIGDTVTLPANTTHIKSNSPAGNLILEVEKGDIITAKYICLSNKYSRAWVLLDTNKKITAWSNPQSNSEPSTTLDYRTNPLSMKVENDGYLILQFPQSNYSDNSGLQVKMVRKKLNNEIVGIEKVEVCVPDEIIAVVGDVLQLYYHSIYRCVDYEKYAIKVTCDVGAQYPRYFEINPSVGQLGNHTLTFAINDNNNNLLGTKSTTLKVVATGTNPQSELNVLCLGASATQEGQWASEFKRRLIGSGGTPSGSGKMNIQFVGRKDVTFDGKQVNLEATGGYTFNSYTSNSTARYRFNVTSENEPTISVGDVYSNNGYNYEIVEINITTGSGGYFSCEGSGTPRSSGTLTKVSGSGSESIIYSSTSFSGNPFVYNGSINMQQYADDYCNPQGAAHGKIDVIYTELFGNGTTVYMDDFTTRMSQMQTFISQVRATFPNCKFCIGLFWNPDIRGGMGRNYGASGTWSDPYGIKYSNMNLCNALQKYITDNNLSDYVFVLNWLNEFDTLNDMQQTMKPLNPRMPSAPVTDGDALMRIYNVKEVFGVNGVHPSVYGYYQMADTAWRLFIAKFCQSI